MQNGPTYIASYPRRFRTSTLKRYAPCHIDACHNALTQPLVAITRGFRHNPFAMLSTAPRSDAKMSLRSRPFHAGLLAAIVAVSLQLVLWSSAIAGGFGSADSSSQPQFHAAYCGAAEPHLGQNGHGDEPARHAACLLCPFCLALSLPATLPPAPAEPPPPALVGRAQAGLAGAACFLPHRWQVAAFPRGPPLT